MVNYTKNLELARYQYLKDIPLLQIIDDVNYPMRKIKRGKASTAILFSGIAALVVLVILSVQYFVMVEKKKLQVST